MTDFDQYSDKDATMAFVLVFLAGLASCVGASAVFFPVIFDSLNNQGMAATSGLVVGCMLYISMVDIYGKATEGFFAKQDPNESLDDDGNTFANDDEEGTAEGKAFIYATLCFFSGMIIMWALRLVVYNMMGQDVHDTFDFFDIDAHKAKMAQKDDTQDELKDVEDEEVEDDTADGRIGKLVNKLKSESFEEKKEAGLTEEELAEMEEKRSKALKTMGLSVGLAMAIHNFPEGLLTFVGYIVDPKLGIILALGIGMHNIPEGLGVAVPVYYATGSKWQGFWWAFLAGATEPLGALFGYFVIAKNLDPNAYGILFGVVAGIMAFIAIADEMPMACRYDPQNKVTTLAVVCGMAAIAGSLALFGVYDMYFA